MHVSNELNQRTLEKLNYNENYVQKNKKNNKKN